MSHHHRYRPPLSVARSIATAPLLSSALASQRLRLCFCFAVLCCAVSPCMCARVSVSVCVSHPSLQVCLESRAKLSWSGRRVFPSRHRSDCCFSISRASRLNVTSRRISPYRRRFTLPANQRSRLASASCTRPLLLEESALTGASNSPSPSLLFPLIAT